MAGKVKNITMDTTAPAAPGLPDLIGLPLVVAHHAGNMRGFHFGEVTTSELGIAGQYALHIQCPWRIEYEDEAILTGFHDWYRFVDNGTAAVPSGSWDPARGGSLQELRLRELFDCPFDTSKTIINRTGRLIVTEVTLDRLGGFAIVLDQRLRIVSFPCSSEGEQWRLFRPDHEGPHLVWETSPPAG